MNKKHFSLLLLGLGLFQALLSGCHTMNGAGQDVERAGQKIQDNAHNHD